MTSSALDKVFRPRSIAVVGASRRRDTIGYQIVDNLLTHGFTGVVYPVNPGASAVHSIPAYPSVTDIPGPVDLAVVVVPKERVLSVIEECGAKGVGAAVIISAGFKEVGPEGARRERDVLEAARRHDIRLVGPNCMGVLSTEEGMSMNATFAPSMPTRGPLSFMSQSGALGVTILDYAAELGIGIHHFASVGNKADISGNDLLQYWAADEGTRVILMYLENFGDPRRFTHLARHVTREKPIVMVKSGRTASGARAASSHTGALAAVDVATDALLAQCGVLRADSVQELFDIAMALEELPIPAGNRVAIVTNAGGPGIMIADACESAGLEIVELSQETQTRLRAVFPAEASVRNPVDMIASATSESYRIALEEVLADPSVDAAIAAFVPPLGVLQVDVAGCIVEAYRGQGRAKPILAVLMGRQGFAEGRAELHEAGVPAYTFPESAARALAAMVRYRRWLQRPAEEPTIFPVDADRVSEILDGAEDQGRTQLGESEALDIFAAYGLPVVKHHRVTSLEEALAAGREIGLPVVLKAVAEGVVHKTEFGAVRLDLRTEGELEAAYREIEVNVTAAGAILHGMLVQEYVTGGREVILGMFTEPTLGPTLMFGLGGIYVEALKDVVFRLAPVTHGDVTDMVSEIRGSALLEGIRGEAPVDRDALVEAIQRISQLVLDHPRISEMDINPLLALPRGVLAVDGRIAIRHTHTG
ncbi:MAG: acetate--CoA ligase family protein [Gemmatimonadota bacterium]|nr:acetate--CoA ligase family protein [Gemmatimonadota bacterium]